MKVGDHVQINRNTVYVVAMVGEIGARASLLLFLKRGHIAFFIAIEGRMFSLLVLLIDIMLQSIDPCAPANTIVGKPDRRLPEGAPILVFNDIQSDMDSAMFCTDRQAICLP